MMHALDLWWIWTIQHRYQATDRKTYPVASALQHRVVAQQEIGCIFEIFATATRNQHMPIGPAIRHMGIPSTTLLGQDAVDNSSSIRIHSALDIHTNSSPTKKRLSHNGIRNEQRRHQRRPVEHLVFCVHCLCLT